jgi:hypothetical protein
VVIEPEGTQEEGTIGEVNQEEEMKAGETSQEEVMKGENQIMM